MSNLPSPSSLPNLANLADLPIYRSMILSMFLGYSMMFFAILFGSPSISILFLFYCGSCFYAISIPVSLKFGPTSLIYRIFLFLPTIWCILSISIYIPVHPCIQPYINLSILSILFICLCIYLVIYTPIYLCQFLPCYIGTFLRSAMRSEHKHKR